MKALRFALVIFLILSVPRPLHSEEDGETCSSSGSIRVTPASASCPYAKKKYTVDMDGVVFGSQNMTKAEKTKNEQDRRSALELNKELQKKSRIANQLERSCENARAEGAMQLHKKMEREARLKNAEDWCRKHCNFVLAIRDKIREGIDRIKRVAGDKYMLINGEEYIEKDGKFVKLNGTARGK